MRDGLVRKFLVIGIIVLFVGVGVYPVIASNSSIKTLKTQSLSNSDLIDVTLEIYGDGINSNTVKLTKEEVEKLKLYLESFNSKINESASIYETIDLYKEAVVELEKYGLLPSDMSIEQGQKLIIGPYGNPKFLENFEKIKANDPESSDEDVLNVFCFLYADLHEYPYTYGGLLYLGVAIYLLFKSIGLGNSPLLWLLLGSGLIYYLLKPFFFYAIFNMHSYTNPSIYSYGLFGYRHDTLCSYIYGFKGFRIVDLNPNNFLDVYLLGHALILTL